MLRPIVALACLLSAPALAKSYDRSDLVRGICRPDGCDEFAVVAAATLTKTGEGTLMQTRVKTFHASSAGRRELSEENGYVYCSRTKPAIVAGKGGRTMAFYLAPFAIKESRETIRQNTNFHALYFSTCHGMEAGRAAAQNLPGVAREFGYRVALPQSQSVALSRVEDILLPENRRPVEARNDVGSIPPANIRQTCRLPCRSGTGGLTSRSTHLANTVRCLPPVPIPTLWSMRRGCSPVPGA
ncbi:hypothetical protein [Microvirga zambiensis]|uniref:hypothetical protein n=1 Tax=Microvirga zambiensis TaxID=1402137 RepID=UPI00191E4E02|nr:hypothetical protein [Microvirga zambiensis]